MASLAFKQRPASALPVRFFALGLLGFLLLNADLARAPQAIRWPLAPGGILLLHLTVLGWITPVMMGADYQLIPVVLHRPIGRPWIADVVTALYAGGVGLFLGGWGAGQPGLVSAGGVAAGCALLLFCAHTGPALIRTDRWGPTALGLGGGLAFLALTAVLGPWMALSLGGTVTAGGFPVLRLLHATAGLGGWLLLTMMGATYRLVPFFAATNPAVPARFGAAAVLGTGAGLCLILASALVPAIPGAAGLAVAGAGVALWMYDLGRAVRHGRQARREPVVAYSVAAAAAVGLGGAVAAAAWRSSPHLALAAATLALLVGPSLLILGQLQKILPFIAALDVSLAAKRRGQVPKTEALFPRERAFVLLWVLGLGFAAELVGVAAGAPELTRGGAIAVLAGAVAYAAQQGRSFAAWARASRDR